MGDAGPAGAVRPADWIDDARSIARWRLLQAPDAAAVADRWFGTGRRGQGFHRQEPTGGLMDSVRSHFLSDSSRMRSTAGTDLRHGVASGDGLATKP